jgi:hypothetical protein
VGKVPIRREIVGVDVEEFGNCTNGDRLDVISPVPLVVSVEFRHSLDGNAVENDAVFRLVD